MANIVETAIGAGSFKTMVEAVKAAGLVETLSGP
jgi:transforming growth factor-beta-induced protein